MTEHTDRFDRPETILCAAVWVDTDKAWPPRRTYAYPKTGILFCGLRHPDCLVARQAWCFGNSARSRASVHQGFLTSAGRFVDREEAGRIAFECEQTDRRLSSLTSEDLY